jgi:hypothetical protein
MITDAHSPSIKTLLKAEFEKSTLCSFLFCDNHKHFNELVWNTFLRLRLHNWCKLQVRCLQQQKQLDRLARRNKKLLQSTGI